MADKKTLNKKVTKLKKLRGAEFLEYSIIHIDAFTELHKKEVGPDKKFGTNKAMATFYDTKFTAIRRLEQLSNTVYKK